jgi:hypothetical protein
MEWNGRGDAKVVTVSETIGKQKKRKQHEEKDSNEPATIED